MVQSLWKVIIECQNRYNRSAQNAFHEDSEVHKTFTDKRPIWVATTPTSCSGNSGFDSNPVSWVSWLMFSLLSESVLEIFFFFYIILKETVVIKSAVSHNGDCEEYKFVGCNYVYSGRGLPTFLRSIVAPSSGSQITGRCIQGQKRLFQILLNLFFTLYIYFFRRYII